MSKEIIGYVKIKLLNPYIDKLRRENFRWDNHNGWSGFYLNEFNQYEIKSLDGYSLLDESLKTFTVLCDGRIMYGGKVLEFSKTLPSESTSKIEEMKDSIKERNNIINSINKMLNRGGGQ